MTSTLPLAMLLYDTTLTLATETHVVWRRRITFAGYLHIINRYAQITAYIAALVITFPVSNHVSSPSPQRPQTLAFVRALQCLQFLRLFLYLKMFVSHIMPCAAGRRLRDLSSA